jgi:hypothetical protein
MADPPVIRGRPTRSIAVALLQAQRLPVSDITDEHLEHFFGIVGRSIDLPSDDHGRSVLQAPGL